MYFKFGEILICNVIVIIVDKHIAFKYLKTNMIHITLPPSVTTTASAGMTHTDGDAGRGLDVGLSMTMFIDLACVVVTFFCPSGFLGMIGQRRSIPLFW